MRRALLTAAFVGLLLGACSIKQERVVTPAPAPAPAPAIVTPSPAASDAVSVKATGPVQPPTTTASLARISQTIIVEGAGRGHGGG
jgi:hypothetical protein